MHNLASVYETQGHYKKAETLVRQALEIQRRTLGEEHPSTLTSMGTLAIIYRGERRYEEAETLIRQALEGSRRTLGEEHPETINCMANLVAACQCQGRYKEAHTVCDEAIEICRRTLGKEHPYTGGLVAVLSWLLATAPNPADRDPVRALALAKEAVELQSNDADYWGVLGAALYRNGEFHKALEALEKAHAMHSGRDPEYLFFLVMAYWQTGQREKARESYKEAASWLKSGDRHEDQHRFADEAKNLIRLNDLKNDAQSEAQNGGLSDE
jgi:tetratricopeptide (TPR) repeat protein